jgi:predicted nucleic-acid-binding protein
MKNIFVIDANVILRYLLQDHLEHFQKAYEILEQVKTGQIGAYVPEGVLVECVYVLLKVYRVPRNEIATSLSGILHYAGIINENRPILIESLKLFRDNNVDIVDAIVFATAERKGWTVFSFDKDLKKLT